MTYYQLYICLQGSWYVYWYWVSKGQTNQRTSYWGGNILSNKVRKVVNLCLSLVSREMIQIQCTCAYTRLKVSALDEHQHQCKFRVFESFLKQQDVRVYWPNSYTTEKQNHLLMFVKNYRQNGFKMPLNMNNINNFTQWKNGSVDVSIVLTIMHDQKHLSQSGCSM